MLVVIIILLILLVILLVALLVHLYRMRSDVRSRYHARVTVSDGAVVTNKAADRNELIYGENQYNDTILSDDMGGYRSRPVYTLYLNQVQTGFVDHQELINEISAGRSELKPGHIHVDGEGISRMHCRFFLIDGVLYTEDLNSGNGTYVNGTRIHTPVPLQNFDTVYMGKVPFVVYLEVTE